MDKDIEILESIIKVNKDFLQGVENQTINQKELQAIENLIKRNKELEEHLQEFYNAELFTVNQAKLIEKKYIPKSRIKKRYEQLKHYDFIEINELIKLLESKGV